MNYSSESTTITYETEIKNYLSKIGKQSVKDEILKGLRSSPKYISPKFFYDKKGSELFEEITKLNEYYPTRTESEILTSLTDRLEIDFSELNIIELGSGDPTKITLLLNQAPYFNLSTIKYYPVDISESAILNSSEILLDKFPYLQIEGIVADFIQQINLVPKGKKRLFCFFGSTIGNFNKDEIQKFMNNIGSEMKIGDTFLLGMDMVKEISVLENAYDDDKGITAEFNKNILNVINNLAGLNFNPNDFNHLSFFNSTKNRIEMHLVALRDIEIKIPQTSETIFIKKDETIHTENSYKFNFSDIKKIASWGELSVESIVTDSNNWFSLVYLKK